MVDITRERFLAEITEDNVLEFMWEQEIEVYDFMSIDVIDDDGLEEIIKGRVKDMINYGDRDWIGIKSFLEDIPRGYERYVYDQGDAHREYYPFEYYSTEILRELKQYIDENDGWLGEDELDEDDLEAEAATSPSEEPDNDNSEEASIDVLLETTSPLPEEGGDEE